MASNLENINRQTVLQNKKNIFKNKTVWIIGAVILALALFLIKELFLSPKGKSVNIDQISKKDIVDAISVTGNIKANKEDKTVLGSAQKVMDVFVNEGQYVKKGMPLVKLDTSDLEYQLKKAMLNLSALENNFNSGRKSLEDALIQARGAVNSAQGYYDQAKRVFDANQVLYDSGYISKEEYESSKQKLTDCETQLEHAKMQLDIANDNLSNYSKSSQLKQQIDQYKTDIENLNKKISESTITANIDGKVVRMDAEKGQYPKPDKNIVQVCDISAYKLNVSLSQYDAVKVKLGQNVSIKVKGVDKKYTGTVSKIGEVANDIMEGTNKESKVEIEITIKNPDEAIKAGYEADADITLSEKKDVVSVNFEAVKQDEKGRYVFVVENGKAVKRYIKTGIETDFEIEVTDGLNIEDRYITNPNDTIKDGDNVETSGGNIK